VHVTLSIQALRTSKARSPTQVKTWATVRPSYGQQSPASAGLSARPADTLATPPRPTGGAWRKPGLPYHPSARCVAQVLTWVGAVGCPLAASFDPPRPFDPRLVFRSQIVAPREPPWGAFAATIVDFLTPQGSRNSLLITIFDPPGVEKPSPHHNLRPPRGPSLPSHSRRPTPWGLARPILRPLASLRGSGRRSASAPPGPAPLP
jgi:hypothetical protein